MHYGVPGKSKLVRQAFCTSRRLGAIYVLRLVVPALAYGLMPVLQVEHPVHTGMKELITECVDTMPCCAINRLCPGCCYGIYATLSCLWDREAPD
jgi:hypothetical protein